MDLFTNFKSFDVLLKLSLVIKDKNLLLQSNSSILYILNSIVWLAPVAVFTLISITYFFNYLKLCGGAGNRTQVLLSIHNMFIYMLRILFILPQTKENKHEYIWKNEPVLTEKLHHFVYLY